jgi:hypothetical protein
MNYLCPRSGRWLSSDECTCPMHTKEREEEKQMTLYTDKQAREAVQELRKYTARIPVLQGSSAQVLMGYVAERLPKEKPKRKVRAIGWAGMCYRVLPSSEAATLVYDLAYKGTKSITVSDEYEIDVDE